jgi:hypothetical protein
MSKELFEEILLFARADKNRSWYKRASNDQDWSVDSEIYVPRPDPRPPIVVATERIPKLIINKELPLEKREQITNLFQKERLLTLAILVITVFPHI